MDLFGAARVVVLLYRALTCWIPVVIGWPMSNLAC
jgi:uncharacterized membrane protein YbhN (UPF0104 family)